ncbi:DUF421 domain-containing protein [Cellulomonas sp. NPDC057328]|uniref:DUF421 domain-containing protein n=1 Tax=Cellulomonas sp. NPDC057328 TaxID=3346101 RepID=UPI0036434232
MWFDSWGDLLRVVLVGAAAYATLVALLRVTGKRSLAKLSAFDLVVTVALGSTLATILLSADVSWTEGATAFVVLLLLQLAVSWTATRVRAGRWVVTAHPTTVLRDGVVDHDALTAQRLTEAELRQAVRSSGVGGLDQVARVVLETDGTLSVITSQQLGDGSALEPEDR